MAHLIQKLTGTLTRELAGKVSVITGSTSGIGLGIAKALASQGSHIILNGFGDQKELETLRTQLEENYKVQVDYSPADMAKPSQIKEMMSKAFSKFGGVDILVNNAGLQHVAPIEEIPDEKWEQIININLSSNFYTIKSVLPYMKEKKWGRIINVSSVHGLVGSLGKGPYVASKHGVNGLTKVVALETAGTGVTVNAICPGFTHTALIEEQIQSLKRKEGISYESAVDRLLGLKQPSKQFVQVDHLGKLVVFLCSDACDQMTGATLNLDGGWIAQ
eukprot:TRINITY_DN1876_c0_g1_i2.p1 TRINITY_DN1876_c0_g1~~TRINITY_DN1876_c0_g1_i2.p1  ORF type:complete len:289 (+),score=51.22 TRINITY_DN1876_c0_g1_i2:45-869(+)